MPKLILTLLFFCCTIQMYSQPPTQEELEERKAKIQLEIQEKEQLLQSVKMTAETSHLQTANCQIMKTATSAFQ